MIKNGKNLNDEQWTKLNTIALIKIYEIIDKLQGGTVLIPVEQRDYQVYLIIYSLINLGGQRLQVFLNLQRESLQYDQETNEHIIIPGVEKVARSGEKAIPLSNDLTILYLFYLHHIRNKLVQKGVESFFLSINGTPFTSNSIIKLISSTIRQYFPGTNISTLSFRRNIMTKIIRDKITKNDNNFSSFLLDVAKAANTSVSIIEQHYNRNSSRSTNRETLQVISSIYTSPKSSEISQMILSITENDPLVQINNANIEEEQIEKKRESCDFGNYCYRRLPSHRMLLAHPGDLDYIEINN